MNREEVSDELLFFTEINTVKPFLRGHPDENQPLHRGHSCCKISGLTTAISAKNRFMSGFCIFGGGDIK